MAAHTAGEQQAATPSGEAKQNCFLCALDPHRCSQPQLEGRIKSFGECKRDGEVVPFIKLDSGTARISVTLTRYYRTFGKRLIALGTSAHGLTIRIYHLPEARSVTEYKGRLHYDYWANSYTLAVLEPDTLLNITDLNAAEYCPRQYLLRSLAPSPASSAAIRGNLVHSCFKELLKAHSRGEIADQETSLAALHRYLEQELERNSLDLALANVSIESIRTEVAPHLESLATWFQNQRSNLWDISIEDNDQNNGDRKQRNTNQVRAETFLLAPEIGLKGRLDLLWQQPERHRLLELKTGGGNGDLPRREHRWQVLGYHALLAVRRDSSLKKAQATLLYSGTPGEAQAFSIPFSVRELQAVNETRNILVLSHVTGIPPAPPGPSRCTKCALLDQCTQVSALLHWQPPQPDLKPAADVLEQEDLSSDTFSIPQRSVADAATLPLPQDQASGKVPGWQTTMLNHAPAILEKAVGNGDLQAQRLYVEDGEFFSRYYHWLQLEGREGEQQQTLLWKMPVAERLERGMAINGLKLLAEPEQDEQSRWVQTFSCINTSELRAGDEILLSDGDPITGEVVTGTIKDISAEQVTIWSQELIAHPALVDRYESNIVHIRTLQNLLRWLQVTPYMRDLVAGKRRPHFSSTPVPPRADFNTEQNLAVTRALQMQDYLLIHGPPGTGKTSVIAEIVRRLSQQGQRVMLAAFTNQAVDNMLKRLEREGFTTFVRLGHEHSVDESMQKYLLKSHVAQKKAAFAQGNHAASLDEHAHVYEVLRENPVIASTTATWSSEKYSPTADDGTSTLQFDVALIDEAGQLTIPAILGALRFAKRFILVGDELQLPPLVLSKVAAEAGLARSLFSDLKQQDDDYMNSHPAATSACVPLRTQYRMHKRISDFASEQFYNRRLQPHESIAHRALIMNMKQLSTAAPAIQKAVHPGSPLVFLDVRSKGEQIAKVSNAEARVVREVMAELLRRGISAGDIGIIAPYRAQVANLRRHLFSDDPASDWQALALHSPISIDTVDRFQGGERPVIIISFATTTPPAAESQQHDFLTNRNRLNVALTRAQRKLILVGCAPALAALPVFRDLLLYCQRLNTFISPFSKAGGNDAR